MWHGAILLHRPFIARWPSNPSASKSAASPLDVCLLAANQICFTLEYYFDRLLGLPCDLVFSIFTAASTLLYHSKHSKNEDIETQRRLKLCIHWLSVLGKSWKSAGARQELLADSEYCSKQFVRFADLWECSNFRENRRRQRLVPSPSGHQNHDLPHNLPIIHSCLHRLALWVLQPPLLA
jgi:hypothetical protein